MTPAADMPAETVRKGGRLVVVNLQKTPLDNICHMRVFAKTDDFMARVMTHLQMSIPQWRLHRLLRLKVSGVEATAKGRGQPKIQLDGLELTERRPHW